MSIDNSNRKECTPIYLQLRMIPSSILNSDHIHRTISSKSTITTLLYHIKDCTPISLQGINPRFDMSFFFNITIGFFRAIIISNSSK